MKVDQDVLGVLQYVECEGLAAKITGGRLEREMYVRVNKVLELAGGKWNRAAKAHLFPEAAADAIEQVLLTGEILDAKQELGAFFTPRTLAGELVDLALSCMLRKRQFAKAGLRALEPSAGEGAIVQAMLDRGIENIVAYEINADFMKRRPLCYPTFQRWRQTDFLSVMPGAEIADGVDIVVMNPPFAKRADIRHITHAARFVRPGGVLVAVASAAVLGRSDRAGVAFRELVEKFGGSIERLPDASFKESGTMVNTVVVTMHF